MTEKIILYLLILCAVSYQGIIATSSNDDIQQSSALLTREKRVVDLGAGGHPTMPIQNANYMTTIKEFDRTKCIGVILSHYSIITAANCITHDPMDYVIFSGSAYPVSCVKHYITSLDKHYGNLPHQNVIDGIALLSVDPPFTFGPKTGSIQLYSGPLPANTQVTISGWGCFHPLIPSRGIQRRLRKIIIPIMNHGECLNVYRPHISITHKHICTYDRQKHCGHTDAGAPLIVDNKLAGIHTYKGEFHDQINPDVFIDLQLPEYREWIIRNTILM